MATVTHAPEETAPPGGVDTGNDSLATEVRGERAPAEHGEQRGWRTARGLIAPCVVVLGALNVVAFLVRGDLLAWAPWLLRGALAVVVPLSLLATVMLAGVPLGTRTRRRSLAVVAARFWLAFVPLLGLGRGPTIALLGASWIAFAFALVRRGQRAGGRREVVASLAAVLAVCVLYVVIGARARGHCDNDALYYFGVARHMVRTGHYEEPLVWQFLAPAASLVHRPFDYWQGLTSLVLVPPLAVFGNTHHTALVTMAVVSCAGLLGFWFLVTLAVPIRSRLARWLACFGFAFAPGMATYRFDTESVPVFQLALVASLAAFARRAYGLSAACAFGMLLSRGEGVWSCAIVWSACAWYAFRERDGERPVRQLGPALVAAGLALAYAGYHGALFHTLAPPGAQMAPRARTYNDMFAFDPARSLPAGLDVLWPKLQERFIADRFTTAVDAIRAAGFASRPEVWLVLLCATGVGVMGGGPPVLGLAWGVLLLGTFLATWSNSIYFAAWRAPHVMLPAAWLLAAAAIDSLVSALAAWSRRSHLRRARTFALGVATFALAAFTFETTPLYGERLTVADRVDLGVALRRLSPTLEGKPVAAVHSWAVMADTSSPVLQVPYNGEAAMVAAFKRYGIAWLLLDGPTAHMDASAPLLAAIERGKRTHLGDLQLVKVDGPPELPLYRVVYPPPARASR